MNENPYFNKIVKENEPKTVKINKISKTPAFKILMVSLIIGITAISAFAVYTTAGTATYKPIDDILVITPEPEPGLSLNTTSTPTTEPVNTIVKDASEQPTSVFSLVQPDSAGTIGVPPTGASPENYIPALQYHTTTPEPTQAQAPEVTTEQAPLSVVNWHLYRDTWSVGDVLHGYVRIANNGAEPIHDAVKFTAYANNETTSHSMSLTSDVDIAALGEVYIDYQANVIEGITPGSYNVLVVAEYHDIEIGRQTFTINIV